MEPNEVSQQQNVEKRLPPPYPGVHQTCQELVQAPLKQDHLTDNLQKQQQSQQQQGCSLIECNIEQLCSASSSSSNSLSSVPSQPSSLYNLTSSCPSNSLMGQLLQQHFTASRSVDTRGQVNSSVNDKKDKQATHDSCEAACNDVCNYRSNQVNHNKLTNVYVNDETDSCVEPVSDQLMVIERGHQVRQRPSTAPSNQRAPVFSQESEVMSSGGGGQLHRSYEMLDRLMSVTNSQPDLTRLQQAVPHSELVAQAAFKQSRNHCDFLKRNADNQQYLQRYDCSYYHVYFCIVVKWSG